MTTVHETGNVIRTIAAGACFLREKSAYCSAVASEIATPEPWNPERRELLERWIRHAGGNGGKSAFLTRLAAEGIEERTLQCLLSSENGAGFEEPLPEWAVRLQKILEPSSSEEEGASIPADSEPLFTALKPFLLFAARALREHLGKEREDTCLPASVHDELLAGLAKRLMRIGEKTYRAEIHRRLAVAYPLQIILGRPPAQEITTTEAKRLAADLRTGGWFDLLRTYPVLGRRFSETTGDWVTYTVELLDRLKKDCYELEQVFSISPSIAALSGIETDASDPHNGGRTVAVLRWKTGEHLVYKPRSGGIDQAWRRWIAWVESAGLPCCPVPAALDKGDYCWVEYLTPRPLSDKEDAELFYHRSGVLLCIFYVLGANDFHMENMIAQGSYPVPVDLETLLVHRFQPFVQEDEGTGAAREALRMLVDSVLHIGLLPVWVTDGRGNAEDISGLTGFAPTGTNLPVLEGRSLEAADYRASLCRGFAQAYAFFLQRREELLGAESPLAFFEGLVLRPLLRPTRVYGDLAERLRHPCSLRGGIRYSLELERMAAAYFLHEPGDQLHPLGSCFASEADALGRGDVPIFFAKAEDRALRDAERVLHPCFFQESALERCRRIISGLSEADLQVQTRFIQTALAMRRHSPAAHSDPAPLLDVTEENAVALFPCNSQTVEENATLQLLSEAESVHRSIMEWRLQGDTGDYSWITLQMEPSSRKILLGPINCSFYDGSLGLGVFFAALSRLTRREEIKKHALQVVASWRRTLRDARTPFPVHRLSLGLGNGVAGLVRGLAVMAQYLEDEGLWDDLHLLCSRIHDEQIDDDRQLDVFGGVAGLILALAQVPVSRRPERMIVLADKCGRRLLSARVPTPSGYRAWDNGLGYAPLSGAAHGAAGIAYALLRLFRLTGDAVYTEAAKEGIAYENELFDNTAGNWPDLRYRENTENEGGRPSFMSGWCSGAPGIGLLRLACLPWAEELKGMIQRDVERALDFTLSHTSAPGDTLCCGNAAMVDFLLTAGRSLDRNELVEHARTRAVGILRQKQRTGRFRFTGSEGGIVFNPALFHGSAGIGYTFLRCCAPEEIVSLLQ